MKVWKLLGIIAISLVLVSLVGCGKAEEESTAKTEAEPVVAKVTVVDYTPAAEDIGTEISCGICGMKMTVTETMPAVTVDGNKYFFCTAEEKAEFAAAPESFMKSMDEAMDEAMDKTEEVIDEAKEKVKEATGGH